MPTFRTALVTELLSARPGLQRIAVRMPDGTDARAYATTALAGECAVGDRVVLNTTAVELGLGTGGWHVVHWNLARDELVQPGPDHVMKLRYTSLQADVGTSELLHPECDDPLDGVPVVACTVHSQVPVVVLAAAARRPGTRVAYVMTDGAALPLALSDTVHELSQRGLLVGTVTAGHAFGGDLEAVSVPAALGLAVHALGAEVVVVGMGPGVVGTGTALGTTAVEAASVLDAAAALGGEPVLCVRASDGDGRERHRGVSHHVGTVARLTSARPLVPSVPSEAADLPGVRALDVADVPDAGELLASAGMRVTTMGRDVGRDPLFFAAAAAAGALAADLVDGLVDGVVGGVVDGARGERTAPPEPVRPGDDRPVH
ncbi:DUF3866 family protein [Dermatobacter hominis]|uniref:DUF3866 family protein n=1 Tax=Dermatobacter hominis TaxID=2884263 RepID=UPI001D113F40|nr:DUF3866 family protein [Dermatobacter hominis]UDY36388.1 DUF3866 family protein [Dermatobacter hominis]